MVTWKLSRLLSGNEEFTFSEGDKVTIGRGLDNTITLSSIVVSRNHCLIDAFNDQVIITDLKSSNGIYVGMKKIPQNVPYAVEHSDIIGFGCTIGVELDDVKDEQKFVFKLIKESSTTLLSTKLEFQDDNNCSEDIEKKLSLLHRSNSESTKTEDPKYKVNVVNHQQKIKVKAEIQSHNLKVQEDDVIDLLSDDDQESSNEDQPEPPPKKVKYEDVSENIKIPQQSDTKHENTFLEYEAFDVKQEYLGYDDGPIQVDSDSESESDQWILRLSQSSPGKPFTRVPRGSRVSEEIPDDCSYSQLDDFVEYDKNKQDSEEDIKEDFITIPPQLPHEKDTAMLGDSGSKKINEKQVAEIEKNPFDLLISGKPASKEISNTNLIIDEVDGRQNTDLTHQLNKHLTLSACDVKKRTQMIDPLALSACGKLTNVITESNKKSSRSEHAKKKNSSSKHTKSKSHSKRPISSSQKYERKKKLKEIAEKEKSNDNNLNKSLANNSNKLISNVKTSSSTRGAFLANPIQIVKPTKRNDSHKTHHNKTVQLIDDKIPNNHENVDSNKPPSSLINENLTKKLGKYKRKSEYKSSSAQDYELIIPLKHNKPVTDLDLHPTEKTYLGKPILKVTPMVPEKPKKKVRFSNVPPDIHEFEIEPGNKMKKTSLAKSSVEHQFPRFSLEKLTLMKILRWNPSWLEEQINFSEPPPILGVNVIPNAKLHTYQDYNSYQQTFGDLLLIEIWECITLAYMKTRNHNNSMEFRIESLPPVSHKEHCLDLVNISVNLSLPSSDTRNVPRVGELLLVMFGPETTKFKRFFYVHNVRCLPSPQTNKNSFYSITLQATFTGKMQSLKQGEVINAKNVVYVGNELKLFEAMEYLNGSPLCDIILRPEVRHFPRIDKKLLSKNNIAKSQWTNTLNASQKMAVDTTISAALADKPSINMIQGPPGTGKSNVVCAIVMSYFYNVHNKRHQNRGKLLICATSNAAVDELVLRLLNIRQNLPKDERFRMVRVGRAESMHPRAFDISSQQLALRDTRKQMQSQAHNPALSEEMFHLEAKLNMWKTAAQEAKDPVRVAYCQTRIFDINKRIAIVRNGLEGNVTSGVAVRADQASVLQSEIRIIERADIVLTTLVSSHSYKMKGLKGRVALCIVDEAGQAIEPETLIPLMLDIKRLTLIGDPQQLPGYICSLRAKSLGLGESLFTRLASCTENWSKDIPVVLLQHQYRMHSAIADYPNRAFYDSKIQTVASVRPKLKIPPYSVVSISSGDKGQGACGANEMEAWGVARLVLALNEIVSSLKLNLGVITPYNAHKDLIKKNLRILDPRLVSVDVNTVDSFQGQERDVVVVSLARSQGVGFLTDTGRMNVMLTRAKHALIVCLNPNAMMRNNQWRTLIEDAQRRNIYKVFPTKVCQPPTRHTKIDDILKYLKDSP